MRMQFHRVLLYSFSLAQCNIVEHRNYKVVYRRYASLFFLMGIDAEEVTGHTRHAMGRQRRLIDPCARAAGGDL